MHDGLVTIRASIEDRLILDSAVAGAQVASVLAEMDTMIATMGMTRDQARDWVRNALETGRYANDGRMTERLLSTLIWLACRGDPSGSLEEALRHGGVTLECNYLGKAQGDEPGVLGRLRFILSTPMVH